MFTNLLGTKEKLSKEEQEREGTMAGLSNIVFMFVNFPSDLPLAIYNMQ